ncbi:Uncharacterised protein [Mycobacteroides abscessus subsp. abscessus]|nr:Uncharacterised protein [Mycobacteroides abscessus subsp. abscessus]SHP25123.1 Uncharacterised protein [Mycobacteroides abscessus subsp. abscessus]SHP72999.1 Uncharacterised protein [Mycobacteroides abscessus subsp. abscessus]SHQ91659.1 Uncharacterised protein [Mycobacteroides abscessus subsp. abscessus]SHR00740.1 Uncharacterised protein [Mycobacteroides abscessus subsp. abscessus]
MSDSEAPLTPGERLLLAGLYARLALSQNRTPLGRLGSERACYADLNICGPETLSHKRIPEIRGSEGLGTC